MTAIIKYCNTTQHILKNTEAKMRVFAKYKKDDFCTA